MVKPNGVFRLITPDQVAETWDGVGQDLYRALWDCVQDYDNSYRANIEDMGPNDVVGINCVKQFWDKFTPEEQEELNKLAEKNG